MDITEQIYTRTIKLKQALMNLTKKVEKDYWMHLEKLIENE